MTLPPRTTLGLAAGALLAGTLLAPLGAGSAGAATPDARGTRALGWLADELDGASGMFTGSFTSGGVTTTFDDYGLTLDAVLALGLDGSHASTATAARGKVEAKVLSYVTGTDFGHADAEFAGALAKTLLAEQVTGGPTTVGGLDLQAELRALLRPAGDPLREGRFSDHETTLGAGEVDADFTNGFTQALAILALDRTTAGVPQSAVDYLLAQQCADGGFRGTYDVDADFDGVADAGSTRGCTAADDSEADATGMAVQALLAVQDRAGIAAPLGKALTYLATPATLDGETANTFGLAAQALRAAGKGTEADAVAAKVANLQLGAPNPDDGAIAIDSAAATAAATGVPAASVAQFWRSTSQGLLAFGLPPFSPADIPPASSTSTTSSSTTSTTAASTTSTTAKAGTTTTTARSSAIPKTGTNARHEVAVALLFLGLGLGAVGTARRRGHDPS
jgi:hypothetical protein